MSEQTKLKSVFPKLSILIKLDEHRTNASSMITAMEQHIANARLKNGGICLTETFRNSAEDKTEILKGNDLRLALLRFLVNHEIDVADIDLDKAEIASLKPVGEETGRGRFGTLLPPSSAQNTGKVCMEAKIRNLVFTP